MRRAKSDPRARPAPRAQPEHPPEGLRSIVKDKYALMESYLDAWETGATASDPAALRLRFDLLVARGRKLLVARLVVTALLAVGLATTVLAAILGAVPSVPFGPDPAAATRLMERLAAAAGSITLLLVALRLALDRMLARVDVGATFVAMRIASARTRD